ncbi:MAG: aminotransferase class I/II-fold pyridoxal phosphate-dependent enzyme [Bacteroidales bacterium]|nr:aminotransferase class I/II-fold pyridoxal phosphate-dependent enzyme [Bacteroidales bacterium]
MVQAANRTKQVGEYYFSLKMDLIRKMVAGGDDIINLAIGNPDIAPPAGVIRALADNVKAKGVHGYQPYRGIKELREAISAWYMKYYGVDTDPESQVLPLIGSKEGIMHISMAYLNRGDAVLIPDPGYPAYAAAAGLCGARSVYYDLNSDNNWLPDLENIEHKDLQGLKLMWINYPNMPSGQIATGDKFREIVRFARKHNILVVNDNPYSFILNDMPLSLLSADEGFDNVLELNSLSKSHNMAGWRIGMLVGHAEHINNVLKIKSNMDSGMFLPVQKAAVEALQMGESWYNELNAIYRHRQELVYKLLSAWGCKTSPGQSGMFLWSEIPAGFADSYEFSDYCLERYHLFIAPGLVFGANGQRYIRVSLCVGESRLKEAIERVKKDDKTNK